MNVQMCEKGSCEHFRFIVLQILKSIVEMYRHPCAPFSPASKRTIRRLMLKTRIIPCLDVADGRVVKGVNFVDLVDAGDPVEAARAYDAAGADELCFLDIHATHENRGTMFDLVRRTAEQCFIPLTVGGGVRQVADVRALLLAGADKVSFNSAAVADPDVLSRAADQFGSCLLYTSPSPRDRG